MESFEHVCRVALESEKLAVTANVKFPVTRQTRKREYVESQTHGHEIDLIGARGDKLVLCEVKSYFGSGALTGRHFVGMTGKPDTVHVQRLRLFNDNNLRQELALAAASHFGYDPKRVEIRLYAGNVSVRSATAIRTHLESLPGARCRLVTVQEVAEQLIDAISSSMYFDDPVVAAMRTLNAAGLLRSPTARR